MPNYLNQAVIDREREIVRRVLQDAVERDWLGVEAGEHVHSGFAYIRVSDPKQAAEDRTGLSREVRNIDAQARRLNLHISFDSVFADDYTGQEERRPGIDRLLATLTSRPKEDRHVLVEAMDRLGRRIGVQFIIERAITRAGGQLHLGKEQDNITKLAMGLAAEIEVEKISERARAANLSRMARGHVISSQPRYGYRLDRSTGGCDLVPDATTRRVPRLIHTWFAQLGSVVKVQRRLHQNGIASPRGSTIWSTDTIYRILTDETYIGVHYQNRYVVQRTGDYTARGRPRTKTVERPKSEWMPVKVPALVPESLFAANRARLKTDASRVGRPPKVQTMLRGLIFCGGCGRRMVLQKGNGAPRYRCPHRSDSEVRRNGKPKCEQVSPAVPQVDDLVWGALSGFLFDPRRLHAHLTEQSKLAAQNERSKPQLHRQLQKAEAVLQRARGAYDRVLSRDDGLTEEVGAALERSRARRDEAANELAAFEGPSAAPALKDIEEQLAPFDANAVGVDARHQIAAAMLDRVVLAGDGSLLELHGVLTGSLKESFDTARPCACVQIASSWARSAVVRRWTCCRQ